MQVLVKTGAGYDRGYDGGNRVLAFRANAEMRLNLRSAGTAEHKHLLGIGRSQPLTVCAGNWFPQGPASPICRAAAPFAL